MNSKKKDENCNASSTKNAIAAETGMLVEPGTWPAIESGCTCFPCCFDEPIDLQWPGWNTIGCIIHDRHDDGAASGVVL